MVQKSIASHYSSEVYVSGGGGASKLDSEEALRELEGSKPFFGNALGLTF